MIWRQPTPNETAKAQLAEFLAIQCNRWNMAQQVARYGGSINGRALRHLRLTAAMQRVREMIGDPPVILNETNPIRNRS